MDSKLTPQQWADLLVDNVSTATQLRVESGELQAVEDWRRNAEALFALAIRDAAKLRIALALANETNARLRGELEIAERDAEHEARALAAEALNTRQKAALATMESAARVLSGALQEGIAASEHNAACKWNACVCWIEPARKRLEAWHATMKALATSDKPPDCQPDERAP